MRLILRVYKGMKLFHKPANFSEKVESFGEEIVKAVCCQGTLGGGGVQRC